MYRCSGGWHRAANLFLGEAYGFVVQNPPSIHAAWLREIFRCHRPLWEVVLANEEHPGCSLQGCRR